MRISSPVFRDGAAIPQRFTCEGEDISPPLDIEDVPQETRALALVVDDPDAPSGTFVHWLLWNLPPDTTELPEAVPHDTRVRSLGNACQGTDDFREVGYRGPCPPRGEHTYRFLLYALDDELDVEPGATRAQLDKAITEHMVAEARLTGTYQK